MTSANEYKLNCLVEGDRSASILVSRDASIERLRELIYEKEKNGLFRDIGPRDLILLKVEINLEPLRGHFSEFRLEHHHQSTKLDDFSLLLSELWNEHPPARHLHVYVMLRSRYGDPRKAEKRNEELKREVEDLRGQLRLCGWRQLGDDNPWKRFGDYWRKQNVETTRGRPSIAFAYEERGEEDPEYRLSLNPLTKNKIIVRDCYRSLYDHILKLRNAEYDGLVLTGQPGTGKSLWLPYALVCLLTEHETVAYDSGAGTFLFFGDSVYSPIPLKNPIFPRAKPTTFCLIDSDGGENPTDTSFMTHATVVDKTFPVIASPTPSRYDSMRERRSAVPMEFMPLWTRDELKKGFEMQLLYDDFRQAVETVVCSLSVDDSSTIAVSPKELKRDDWRNPILSALEMIRDGDDSMDDYAKGDDATGDDAMDDATGDDRDATDNATVEVDAVMDKILDNAIEAYGSSARDVYKAIFSPGLAENDIDSALIGQKYDDLRKTVVHLHWVEADRYYSHSIFSMQVMEPLWQGHLYTRSLGFEVQFKSHWIKTMTLRRLEFLQDLDTVAVIREMKDLNHYLTPSSSFADFLYEGFAVKELATGESSSGLFLMEAEKGKTTFSLPDKPKTIVSPFNRPRERRYPCFSTGPRVLEFNVDPGKSLADYFWIPMAPNNSLFEAFVIEFTGSAPNIDAVVWILRMTLSNDHGGSSEGYQLIKLIKTKVEEAVRTMSHTEQWKRRKVMVNNVILKYVLVSPEGGQWTLPKKKWQSCKGDVYYQPCQLSVVQ